MINLSGGIFPKKENSGKPKVGRPVHLLKKWGKYLMKIIIMVRPSQHKQTSMEENAIYYYYYANQFSFACEVLETKTNI